MFLKGADFMNKKKIILSLFAGIFVLSLGANAYLGVNVYNSTKEISKKEDEIKNINKELEDLKNKYDENLKTIDDLQKKYAESLKAKAEQSAAKKVESSTSTSSTTIAGDASGMSAEDKEALVMGGIIDENGTFLDSSLYFDFKDELEKMGYKFTGEVPSTPPSKSTDSSGSTSSSNGSSSNNSTSGGHDDGNGNWVGGIYAPVTPEQVAEADKKMLEMYGHVGSTDGGKIGDPLPDWTPEEEEYYSRGGNCGYH